MPIYEEIWAGPGRNYKKVDSDGDGARDDPMLRAKWYVTIHCTANDASARDEADYAKVRTDGTGSHYYADDVEVLQSTDTSRCVGHVGSDEGNERGLSYEITGVTGWTRQQWLDNVEWGKLAAAMARDCLFFGIPPVLLTHDQMRAFNAQNKGFITHNMARIVWGGTTHTDPGPNFPMDHLLGLVANALGGAVDPELIKMLEYMAGRMLAVAYLEPKFSDWTTPSGSKPPEVGMVVPFTTWAEKVLADLAAIRQGGAGGGVDPAGLEAAVRKVLTEPAVLAAIAKAVVAEHGRELAD